MLPSGKRYRFLSHIDELTDKQLYGVTCCILFLLQSIGQDQPFRSALEALFAAYPTINQRYMGFHAAWQAEPIWQVPVFAA